MHHASTTETEITKVLWPNFDEDPEVANLHTILLK